MVIKELEIEAKKFEERAKVLEDVLERQASSLSSKYGSRLSRNKEGYIYILFIAMLVLEILVLAFFRARFKVLDINIESIMYLLLAFLALLILMLFFGRRKSEEGTRDIREKIDEYRKVSKFYSRLKEAIERGSREDITKLADEILEDPLLSKALKNSGVGDPKVIAYSLYLYANRDKVDNSEVEEVKGMLGYPLRKLFEGEADEN
ncbi:hypothetical protein [Pyrococcus kukulkanii]|uniref:hypothetical protein n=1 Tax=Pyrococcus kukulkanii TaxID=1609559 RepID=UPI003566A2A0